MGDHEHGLSAQQLGQRLLDKVLVFGIGIGGRLVEQHDGGIFEHGARQSDALHLSAGQVHASRAHDSVGPIGEFLEDIVALRQMEGLQHLFARSGGLRVRHVVRDGGLEQPRVLEDDARVRSQPSVVYLAHIFSPDAHDPFLGIPEARDQVGHGGLAPSRLSYEGAHGAGGNAQRHVVERERRVGLVAERDVVQGYVEALGLLRDEGAFQHGLGENIVHGVERCAGDHEIRRRVHDARKHGHGHGDEHAEENEGRRCCGCRRTALRAVVQDDGGRNEKQEPRVDDDGVEAVRQAHGERVLEHPGSVLLHRVVIALERLRRLTEHLHHGDAAHVLGGGARHVLCRLLLFGVEGLARVVQHPHQHEEPCDQGCQAGERKAPVEGEHARDICDRQCDGIDEVGYGVRNGVFDVIGVLLDYLAQLARGICHVIAQGDLPQVARDAVAQAGNRVERRQMREEQADAVYPECRHDEQHRVPAEGRHRLTVDRGGVAGCREHSFAQVVYAHVSEQVHGCGDCHGCHADNLEPAIAAHEREQSPHRALLVHARSLYR